MSKSNCFFLSDFLKLPQSSLPKDVHRVNASYFAQNEVHQKEK